MRTAVESINYLLTYDSYVPLYNGTRFAHAI
jgi:hypothetical protein